MKKIKIGIIGAGGIARGHAKRLRQDPQVKIAALAEPSDESLERFAQYVFPEEKLPTVYPDHKSMLGGKELDAVLIASPHTLHYEQIIDCLDAGLHVLAEKPLVCSTDETKKVIRKAKTARRHVVVAYQRRFNPRFRYMRRLIRSEEFGRIFFVASFLSQGWLYLTARART